MEWRCSQSSRGVQEAVTLFDLPSFSAGLLVFCCKFGASRVQLCRHSAVWQQTRYKILIRFTMESCEAVVDRDDGRAHPSDASESQRGKVYLQIFSA